MNVGIYKIVNLANNKLYIGSSKCLAKRWYMHKYNLRKNKHHCRHLQYSYNKYGESNFRFDIIEECEIENLLIREQFYLDIIKPEYNLCTIAGTCAGRKLSLEHKEKISKANKNKIRSEEQKIKISEFMKTRPCSLETRLKMSTASKNRKCSEETKQKISAIHKGKKLTDKEKLRLREVNLRKNARIIRGVNDVLCVEFDSIYDACLELKMDSSSLRKVLNGKAKTCKGYKWRYK